MRRFLAVSFGLVSVGLLIGPASAMGEIKFSFRGYANNVKVVKPLVGPWQLGVARIHGSGRIGEGSDFSGSLEDDSQPKFSRYPPASMRSRVVGYRYSAGAHNAFRKLKLTIEITDATNGGKTCDPGVRGTITIYDSKAKLDNGEPQDYIVMGHWTSSRCPGFVQGWTNEDGGERTSPTFGGPPNGGQWAVVKIRSS
jgi:hypothetical protein